MSGELGGAGRLEGTGKRRPCGGWLVEVWRGEELVVSVGERPEETGGMTEGWTRVGACATLLTWLTHTTFSPAANVKMNRVHSQKVKVLVFRCANEMMRRLGK